jgi:hypothetical protein
MMWILDLRQGSLQVSSSPLDLPGLSASLAAVSHVCSVAPQAEVVEEVVVARLGALVGDVLGQGEIVLALDVRRTMMMTTTTTTTMTTMMRTALQRQTPSAIKSAR